MDRSARIVLAIDRLIDAKINLSETIRKKYEWDINQAKREEQDAHLNLIQEMDRLETAEKPS